MVVSPNLQKGYTVFRRQSSFSLEVKTFRPNQVKPSKQMSSLNIGQKTANCKQEKLTFRRADVVYYDKRQEQEIHPFLYPNSASTES